jgi:hypothetical protein
MGAVESLGELVVNLDAIIGTCLVICGLPLVYVGHRSEQCGELPGFFAGMLVGCPMLAFGIGMLL